MWHDIISDTIHPPVSNPWIATSPNLIWELRDYPFSLVTYLMWSVILSLSLWFPLTFSLTFCGSKHSIISSLYFQFSLCFSVFSSVLEGEVKTLSISQWKRFVLYTFKVLIFIQFLFVGLLNLVCFYWINVFKWILCLLAWWVFGSNVIVSV
jgi:hypothetical protein